MRKGIVLICIAISSCVLYAQRVKVVYNILDEDKKPIINAVVKTITERDRINLSWLKPIPKKTWEVKTDKKGVAVTRFNCYSSDFDFEVSACGFYPERFCRQHFKTEMNSSGTDYLFLECEKRITVVLRKVKNPVDMISHRFTDKDFPRRNGEFGFDLEMNDWTAPFGRGVVSDITFTYNLTKSNNTEYCSGTMSFCNGGGAYKMKKQKSSSFESVYEADTNETFLSEFPFSSYFNSMSNDYGSVRIAENDEYLVYRTRVVKDMNGEIVSANYGKIYGMIRTVGVFQTGESFFNSTPNDTNLEAKK